VLGLAPLLFERSSQAAFLKPTIITLAYGLGFGMILVLLVVPAILAAQEDVTRMIRAARRSLRRGPRALAAGAMAACLALGCLVLLPALVTGTAPGWLGLGGAGPGMALGIYIAGSALICAAAWLAGRVSLKPARQSRGTAS
jgi:hypothetical protein